MAQRSKKRKKISRRQRQQSATQVKKPAAATTADASDQQAATSSPVAPAPTTPVHPQPPAATQPPAKVTAAFAPPTRRGPDGIDAELTSLEYPAVRADLHRLAFTLAFFILVLAGLTILGDTTSLIDQTGRGIFHLWR